MGNFVTNRRNVIAIRRTVVVEKTKKPDVQVKNRDKFGRFLATGRKRNNLPPPERDESGRFVSKIERVEEKKNLHIAGKKKNEPQAKHEIKMKNIHNAKTKELEKKEKSSTIQKKKPVSKKVEQQVKQKNMTAKKKAVEKVESVQDSVSKTQKTKGKKKRTKKA